MTKAASGTIRQFRRTPQRARKRPQMALPYQDAGWWVLANLDSVLVSAAEGTSAAWYQRDPKLFRSLGWRSLIAHRRLRRNWARLAQEYRDALGHFASPQSAQQSVAARRSTTHLVASELRSHRTARPVLPNGRTDTQLDGTGVDGTEHEQNSTEQNGRAGQGGAGGAGYPAAAGPAGGRARAGTCPPSWRPRSWRARSVGPGA
jgi:hypothetical protein